MRNFPFLVLFLGVVAGASFFWMDERWSMGLVLGLSLLFGRSFYFFLGLVGGGFSQFLSAVFLPVQSTPPDWESYLTQQSIRVSERGPYGSLVEWRGGMWRSSLHLARGQECIADFSIHPRTTEEGLAFPSVERLRRAREDEGRLKIYTSNCEVEKSSSEGGVAHRLFRALWLGDQSALAQSWWRDLNHLSMSHLIVVSGSHLAMIVGFWVFSLSWVVRRFALPAHYLFFRASVATVVLGLCFLWPPEVPILRAAAAYLSRSFLGYWWPAVFRFRLSEWTMMVAILFALIFPAELHTKSFLFSFGAAWSLAAAHESRATQSWMVLLVPSFFVAGLASFWALDQSGLSVLLSLPMIAFFGFILMPGVAVAEIFGGLSAIERIAQTFIESTHQIAEFSRSSVIQPSSPAWLGLGLFFLMVVVLCKERAPLFKKLCLLIPLYGALFIPVHLRPTANQLEMIDVGQGDGFILSLDGRRMVIDGGDRPHLVDSLLRSGRAHVDLWVLSHFDQDHSKAVLENLHRLSIEQIWVPRLDRSKLSKSLRSRAVIELGSSWREWTLGDWRVVGVVPTPGRRGKIRNKNSLCLFVFKKQRLIALFLGDLDAQGERRLMELWNFSDARLPILKVAHHGSRSSSSQELLSQSRPQSALVSSGRVNQYGHPHYDVIDRLERTGSFIMSTSAQGSVILDLDRI